MIDRLPYILTAGVTATREGLTGDVERIGRLLDLTPEREEDPPIVQWPDAAERLRYREGEPGAIVLIWTSEVVSMDFVTIMEHHGDLNYIAAVIAPTAEAFRVLHWCITNLGVSNE